MSVYLSHCLMEQSRDKKEKDGIYNFIKNLKEFLIKLVKSVLRTATLKGFYKIFAIAKQP